MRLLQFLLVTFVLLVVVLSGALLAVSDAAPSDNCRTITARRDRLRRRLDACEAQLPACAREVECRRTNSQSDECVQEFFVCDKAAESSKACGNAYAAWREAWAEWLAMCEGM